MNSALLFFLTGGVRSGKGKEDVGLFVILVCLEHKKGSRREYFILDGEFLHFCCICLLWAFILFLLLSLYLPIFQYLRMYSLSG